MEGVVSITKLKTYIHLLNQGRHQGELLSILGILLLLFLPTSCSDEPGPTGPPNCGTCGNENGACINYADFLHIAG